MPQMNPPQATSTRIWKFLNLIFFNTNRPFQVFFFSTFDTDKLGTNRRHHWKKLLKISKIAKFESDLLKINEDIAPRSREILQTLVWWRTQTCPPPYQRLQIFATLRTYIFARLRRITFKFGNFTNIKALFPVVSTDFPNLSMSKVEKTVKRSILGDGWLSGFRLVWTQGRLL